MLDPATYVANTVAMWASLAPTSTRTDTHFRADLPASTRIILLTEGQAVGEVPAGRRVTVEDSWDAGATAAPGFEALRMPVMVRPPQPVGTPSAHAIRVDDEERLAQAERVMVEGFPLRGFQPLTRGAALPPRLLTTPGWDVWLGYRHDEPAVAMCTFDDGRAVGVYWLATMPDHRSAGLGRAALSTALATAPHRPWTLVATDAGRPLYESLGFRTVSTATWYTRH